MWLKWLEKKWLKNCSDQTTPQSHLQFALHGLVKLQVSCSLKCKIIISQQGTRFSLMPFGQLERFPCCPVFQRCVAQRWCLTCIERSHKSQKAACSKILNWKRREILLLYQEICSSVEINTHLPQVKPKRGVLCVNACSSPAVQPPQGRRPDNTN